jgi:hypothetical protein
MSFSLSEGPDIGGTVGIGHLQVVIGNAAYLSQVASFVEDVALFFDMPSPIAEQALVDLGTVVCGVSVLAAPQAVDIAFIGAVLPPIHEVIKTGVKHGDVQGCRGIMEDVWLEVAEGIGMGQGA